MRTLALAYISIFSCALLVQLPAGAQNFQAEWQKRYGTQFPDNSASIIVTGNHQLLIGCQTTGGVYPGWHGGDDIWLVKFNSQGQMTWNKSYGGSRNELMDGGGLMVANNDGTFVIAASTSSNNGDVSGLHDTTQTPSGDVWLFKIDSAGSVLWQRTIGGSYFDGPVGLLPAPDKGFYIVGNTNSGDGDLPGNHGSLIHPSVGYRYDYLVARTDSGGNILWVKSFGGSYNDKASGAALLQDGSLLICGYTLSTDGDVSGNHNAANTSPDVWLVDVSNTGGIVWSKCVGSDGIESGWGVLEKKNGNGFMLMAYNGSTTGDFSGMSRERDVCLFSMTNTGQIEWKRNYGGSGMDVPKRIIHSPYGGYIITAETFSNDLDVSGRTRDTFDRDIWVFETDELGNLLRGRSFGGTSSENVRDLVITDDSDLIVTGTTTSTDGDLAGTTPLGGTDNWTFRLTTRGLGFAEEAAVNGSTLRILPNAASTAINVTGLDGRRCPYRIFSAAGRLVKTGAISSSDSIVDVRDLSSGTYYLSCLTSQGLFNAKFIKL